MIYQSEYEKGVYDKTDISHTFPPTREENLETIKNWQSSGPNTYLHAVAGKGWPYDHKAEDTFEVPTSPSPYLDPEGFRPLTGWPKVSQEIRTTVLPHQPMPNETSEITSQYSAVYTTKGGVELILETVSTYRTRRLIGTFDTHADAQIAAEALNNHSGY